MVEYEAILSRMFAALADPTRRDVLQRIANRELSINELAEPYRISLAAVSKHLKLLDEAGLIVRRQQGRKYFVRLNYGALRQAEEYLQQYGGNLSQRLDRYDGQVGI